MKNVMKKAAALCIAIAAFAWVSSHRSDDNIRARVVRLVSDESMCSGEQIKAPSGQNYILTAAHCKHIAKDGSFKVITEDGKTLQRKLIAEDAEADLLLIEGLPGVEGLDIAGLSYMRESVRTFTHGANLDTYKTDGVLIQKQRVEIPIDIIDSPEAEAACKGMAKYKISEMETFFGAIKACVLSVDEIATTALIVPGSSGGPVVDNSGDLVGVVSAGGGGFGWLVPLVDIRLFIASY